MNATSAERELHERITRLEAELVDAKRMIAETIETHNLKVGRLEPYSLFDRHGSVAIVFAIFLQTAGAIWWASSLSTEVHNLEQGAAAREQAIAAMARTVQDNAERLTRVQAVQENVVKILDRLLTDGVKSNNDRFKDGKP